MHFSRAVAKFYELHPGNTRYSVVSVDVVQNPVLEANFRKKQEKFRNNGIPHQPVFGLHGTNSANIDSILKNNFDLSKRKGQAYGYGIYFSEQPEVSIGQGYVSGCKSVIMCQILDGNSGINCKVYTS